MDKEKRDKNQRHAQESTAQPPPGFVFHDIHLELPKGGHAYFETTFSKMDGGLECFLSGLLRDIFKRTSRDHPQFLELRSDAPPAPARSMYIRKGFERKSYVVVVPEGAAEMIDNWRTAPGGGLEATLSKYFTHANGRVHEEGYQLPMVIPTRGRPRGSGRSVRIDHSGPSPRGSDAG